MKSLIYWLTLQVKVLIKEISLRGIRGIGLKGAEVQKGFPGSKELKEGFNTRRNSGSDRSNHARIKVAKWVVHSTPSTFQSTYRPISLREGWSSALLSSINEKEQKTRTRTERTNQVFPLLQIKEHNSDQSWATHNGSFSFSILGSRQAERFQVFPFG